MTAVSLETRRCGGPLPVAVESATARWQRRDGLLIVARARSGEIGLGEATPLPGYSRESLSEVEAALTRATSAGPLTIPNAPGGDVVSAVARIAGDLVGDLPSARFGLESALLSLIARQRACALHQLLGGPTRGSLLLAAVVPPDPVPADLSRFSALKLKLGSGRPGDEIARLRALIHQFPGARWRLDANRSWRPQEARSILADLAEFADVIDFIEEPTDLSQLVDVCAGETFRTVLDTPIRIAADESLDRDDTRAEVMARADVVVLKPAKVGGIAATLALARAARSLGRPAVLSHLFDGPIALATYRDIALANPAADPALADGLGAHIALSAFPELATTHEKTIAIERTGVAAR